MKICGIRTYKFSVPTGQEIRDPDTGELLCSTSKPWLFLNIDTDAGLSGWGEGTGEWLVPGVEATLHDWAVLLDGRDPLPVTAICDDILDRVPWRPGPVFGTALAAITAALYDIAGKAWGVPVHTILGGARRQRVRVYGHCSLDDPADAAAQARRVQELGFAGVKGNPLETRTWVMDPAAIERSIECVSAMRAAVGDDFDLLLDTHGSPSAELSVEFARRLAPYRPLFLEEPVKDGSVEALLEVARNSPVPIASGEKLVTVRDFLPLIRSRACAYLQPDVAHCFGIDTLVDIGRLADLERMHMAPHNAGGPLTLAASLAADAVTPNFLIQELSQGWFARFGDYVDSDWRLRDGHVELSDRPGLGVEVKEADIAKLPYEPLPYRQYRHFDGSWKGW